MKQSRFHTELSVTQEDAIRCKCLAIKHDAAYTERISKTNVVFNFFFKNEDSQKRFKKDFAYKQHLQPFTFKFFISKKFIGSSKALADIVETTFDLYGLMKFSSVTNRGYECNVTFINQFYADRFLRLLDAVETLLA